MKKKAFAKINLCLDVVGRREDGYHELEMVMTPIDLFDTVDIQLATETTIQNDKSFLPDDERNTVIKAIEILRSKYQFTDNFLIRLIKNTPTQAGLAGGSSDAASTIKIINELLKLNMSAKEMFEVAQQVGSDVPFCLYGKPALVKGVGEKLSPIEINLDFHLFLVKPRKGVSTKKAFMELELNKIVHPDIRMMLQALKKGNYQSFLDSLGNSLEDVAIKEVAEIALIKEELLTFGFDAALMSGSGSTVFAITQDEKLVDAAVNKFWNHFWFVKKSRIISDTSACEMIS